MRLSTAGTTLLFATFMVATLMPRAEAATSTAATVAEVDGIVAVEIERATALGGWQSRTDVAGFSGSAFYHNSAGNTSTPGNDILAYPFVVTNAGRYQLQWRSRINEGSNNTEANDSFVRLVDHTGAAVTPVANSNVATSGWYKIYMNTTGNWVWQASNKDHDPKSVSWNLAAGQTYTVQVSRRSHGHALDRLVLWHHDLQNLGNKSTGQTGSATALNNLAHSPDAAADNGITISGERKRWHKTTLSFAGVTRSQADAATFRDYRLDVTFTRPGGGSVTVPGYFAADGNAGESGADSGNIWRAHLLPDQVGTWTYSISYKTGANIAYAGGGSSAGAPDGASGSFVISDSDKAGDDFRAGNRGRLEYVGEHALRWRGSNDYFFKVGMNHPEVFLEYVDFAGTDSTRSYPDHVAQWQDGDPTWQGGKGKGIIGVINYLNAQRLNVHYFLLMNTRGDGKKAFPWTSSEAVWNYHVAKLDQWQIVFDHMMSKGVMTHFVFDEQENQTLFEHLEAGTPYTGFANSRKVYYREMVARFGYLNAITWNIGEESGWQKDSTWGIGTTTQQRQERAAYVRSLLPYADHIVVHNGPSNTDAIFTDLIGDPAYTGPSFQGDLGNTNHGNGRIAHWRQQSAANGRKWVVCYDEPYVNNSNPNRDSWRKTALWASLAAGGAGAELYTGADLSLQNYTTYAGIYSDMRHAYNFITDHQIPFWSMNPDNSLVSSGWCLASPGSIYVIYLQNGGSTNLTLPNGEFTVRWYDPRNGGALQTGSIATVSGGAARSLGSAPSDNSSDWAILVTSSDGGGSNQAPTAAISSPGNGASFAAPAEITITATATDSDGSVVKVEFFNGASKIGEDNSAPFSFTWSGVPAGSYSLTARATDDQGATGSSAAVSITVTGVSTPFGGTPWPVPGRIQFQDFDAGGLGTAYHDSTGSNQGNSSYRSGETVDLQTTTDTGGGHNIGWTVAGEWLHYTVIIAEAGLYDLDIRSASNDNGASNRRLRLEIDGADLSGLIQLPYTGNWTTYTTTTVSGLSLPAGTYRLRVLIEAGGTNLNWFEFRSQSLPTTRSIRLNSLDGYQWLRLPDDDGQADGDDRLFPDLDNQQAHQFIPVPVGPDGDG